MLVRLATRLHVLRNLPSYRHIIQSVETTLSTQTPPQNDGPSDSDVPTAPELCLICATRRDQVRLSCGHCFCGHCPAQWQSQRTGPLTCPLCRAETTAQTLLPGTDPADVLPLRSEEVRPRNLIGPRTHPHPTHVSGEIYTINIEGTVRCLRCDTLIQDTYRERMGHIIRCRRT